MPPSPPPAQAVPSPLPHTQPGLLGALTGINGSIDRAALRIKPASPVYTVCDSQSIILAAKIWCVCSMQPLGLRKPPRLGEKKKQKKPKTFYTGFPYLSLGTITAAFSCCCFLPGTEGERCWLPGRALLLRSINHLLGALPGDRGSLSHLERQRENGWKMLLFVLYTRP